MTLQKIISGGQTGADLGGLVGARRVGLQTGGTAPKGYRTERGKQPTLQTYGLVEHPSPRYPPRTACNVVDSDATVLFGDTTSPGCALTLACLRQHGKPFLANPSAATLRAWVETHQIRVLNVAGNRESKHPGLTRRVAALIAEAFGA